jgi:hypothetical protein
VAADGTKVAGGHSRLSAAAQLGRYAAGLSAKVLQKGYLYVSILK